MIKLKTAINTLYGGLVSHMSIISLSSSPTATIFLSPALATGAPSARSSLVPLHVVHGLREHHGSAVYVNVGLLLHVQQMVQHLGIEDLQGGEPCAPIDPIL